MLPTSSQDSQVPHDCSTGGGTQGLSTSIVVQVHQVGQRHTEHAATVIGKRKDLRIQRPTWQV